MFFLAKLRTPFKYSFNNITLYIVGLNVLVFLLIRLFPNLYLYLSMFPLAIVKNHAYWQFFTYMFVHDISSIQHILFNVIGLLIFGSAVEKTIGSKEFTLMYLLSGVFCGLISFVFFVLTKQLIVVMCGASGCLYAIMLVFAVLFPKSTINIWGILPVPSPLLVLVYGIIAIVSQLFSLSGGIAHIAHLGGFVFAWIYLIIRMNLNPWKVWKDAYK